MIRKTLDSHHTFGCQQSCQILWKLFPIIIFLCALVHHAMAETKPNTDTSPPEAEQGSSVQKIREEEDMETDPVQGEKDEAKNGQEEKKPEEEPSLKDAEQPPAAAAKQGVDEEESRKETNKPGSETFSKKDSEPELASDSPMDTAEPSGTADNKATDEVRDGQQPKSDDAETAKKATAESKDEAKPPGAEGQSSGEAHQREGKPPQNKDVIAASTTSTTAAEDKDEVTVKSSPGASSETAKPPVAEGKASSQDHQMSEDQPTNDDKSSTEAKPSEAESQDHQMSEDQPTNDDKSSTEAKPPEAESQDHQTGGDQPKNEGEAASKMVADNAAKLSSKALKEGAESPEAEGKEASEASQMDGEQQGKKDDGLPETAAEKKDKAAAAPSPDVPMKTAKRRHHYGKDGQGAAEKQEPKKGFMGKIVDSLGSFFSSGSGAKAEEDYNFPTDLAGFEMEFNKDGELRNIETGEPFQFEVHEEHSYNQRRYEALGEIITEHVYGLLEKETNLKRKYLPLDAEEDEPRSFIFVTDDAMTNPDKLMILIHGSGVVRAGQWARRLIINDRLDCGTQLPFIKRAIEQGYGVMVLNTNLNYVIQGGYRDSIRNNESPEEHTEYVWTKLVSKASAKHIAIVAHSYGGVSTTYLASQHMEEFSKRVFAIAFTDSVHSLPLQGAPNATCNLFRKIAQNWVASDLPLDTRIKSSFNRDAELVSAGHRKHEWTSWSSFESIFKYFQQKYEELQAKDEL